jgi:MOSC domain-containing protein YiiM
MATVVSVNVGKPRSITRGNGEQTTTAIWKTPVSGRVAVRGVNLDGDDQADRTVHGGPDQAVYAYAIEDTEWWESELGRELGPGAFGENLTLRGVDVTHARIGERWAVGTTVLEVSSPRIPCWKLARRMDDPLSIKRFSQAGRPGAYLRIVEEGDIGAGDSLEVISRPTDQDVDIALMNQILLFEHGRAGLLLAAPIAPRIREWALQFAA